ncbi:HNH endonuclease signature motif containing protein [Tessaracoccus sp. ZS01]|uniref:HNH endonuclease signature motif containing protein n=1 Tax=Tessaracoccus sp. ZS01 TaxID=1906324 RepID=UPI00096FBB64|nr:HNH endonuclease signature motif containing protein [Tessaracoccus sp. ZS01]MCG6567830.1 HNH endonuclease [Tessaracoccus sp. ZS01]OMG55561.1 hypothetical protein BJN44_09405 [Tessaracoccus sp. ZS01]
MHVNRRSTQGALEVAREALSSIDHSEREGLTAAELVGLMQLARNLADRFSALASTVTSEVDRRRSAREATGTELTALISTTEGLDSRDAAGQVFQAAEISRHEPVRDAALAGNISPKQAVAVAKGMATLPELPVEIQRKVEEAYVGRALEIGATPRKLRDIAPLVLAEVAPELLPSRESAQEHLAAQAERARARRYFDYSDDGAGAVKFHGCLPELEAVPLLKLVEGYVERDRRAQRRRLAGLAGARASASDIRSQRVLDLNRTPGQRRADALLALVADHRERPVTSGDRPRVVVEMTLQELRGQAEEARLLPEGKQVAAGDLRRLLCDADVMPAVLGGRSEVLDVGQAQRLVTPAMRRALTIRDKGCIFPGCCKPDASCEAHHVIPWWAGGATSLRNLALLCPFHHSQVEPDRYRRSDQWKVIMDPLTQRPRVVPPDRHSVFTRRGSGSARGPD